jgi:IclR family transcriptional regulator, acetate operon repressor
MLRNVSNTTPSKQKSVGPKGETNQPSTVPPSDDVSSAAFDAGAPVRLAGRVKHQPMGLEAKRSWGQSAFDTSAPEATKSDFTQPRATERGLGLVSIVGDHPSGITLADAARASDLMPSTALRQLRSLAAMGYSVQREDGKWVPGPELLRLARALIDYATVGNLSQPTLASLAAATGESAYVAERQSPTTAVYVAMEPSRHTVRHVSWLGQSLDCRTTAVGAALRNTVDADGVAVRHDAVEAGVTAISAPIRGEGKAVLAAISVVGPTYRLEAFGLSEARRLVGSAATQISELLRSR